MARTLCQKIVGSRLYNLHNDSSDFDIRAIVRYDIKRYLSLNPLKDNFIVKDGNYTIESWELKKFLNLCAKNGWGAFELFYANSLTESSEEWHIVTSLIKPEMFDIRELMYHCYGVVKNFNQRAYIKAYSYLCLEFFRQNAKMPENLDYEYLLENVTLGVDTLNYLLKLFKDKKNGIKTGEFNHLHVTDEDFKLLPKQEQKDYSDVFYTVLGV